MEKVTARDVLEAIFVKHDGPEWVRFAEVSNSTGHRANRRADAICMNIWPSKGYAIHGYEIKVSRADFIHEMKNIAKAEAIGQYCDFWWLAAPKGMIDPKEVPEAWGLIELQKNGLRIKKQAPKKDAPPTLPRDFMSALLRRSRDQDDAYIATMLERKAEQQEANLKREIELRNKRAREQAEKNAEWIAQFEDTLGVRFSEWEAPEAMAQRLKVAKSLELGSLTRMMTVCAQVVKEISDLGNALPEGREAETQNTM